MTTETTRTVQPKVTKRSRRMALGPILVATVVVSAAVAGTVIFGDSGAGSSALNAPAAGQPAPVAVPLPRLVR